MSNSVFVVAFGRTGSTLLSKLLAQSADVFSAGEFYPVNIFRQPNLPCSCGQQLSNCTFYDFLRDALSPADARFLQSSFNGLQNFSSIVNKLRFYPAPLALHALRQWIFSQRDIIAYVGIIDRLKEATLQHYGRTVFIDAGKQYYQLSLLLQGQATINRVIFLTRNPIGIYASNKRYAPNYDREHFIRAWNRQNRQIAWLKAMKPEMKWYHLNFDDFVANGASAMQEVLDFIGAKGPVSPSNVSGSHFMGNKFVVNNEVPELKPDLRWKEELSEKEVQYLKERLSL